MAAGAGPLSRSGEGRSSSTGSGPARAMPPRPRWVPGGRDPVGRCDRERPQADVRRWSTGASPRELERRCRRAEPAARSRFLRPPPLSPGGPALRRRARGPRSAGGSLCPAGRLVGLGARSRRLRRRHGEGRGAAPARSSSPRWWSCGPRRRPEPAGGIALGRPKAASARVGRCDSGPERIGDPTRSRRSLVSFRPRSCGRGRAEEVVRKRAPAPGPARATVGLPICGPGGRPGDSAASGSKGSDSSPFELACSGPSPSVGGVGGAPAGSRGADVTGSPAVRPAGLVRPRRVGRMSCGSRRGVVARPLPGGCERVLGENGFEEAPGGRRGSSEGKLGGKVGNGRSDSTVRRDSRKRRTHP